MKMKKKPQNERKSEPKTKLHVADEGNRERKTKKKLENILHVADCILVSGHWYGNQSDKALYDQNGI